MIRKKACVHAYPYEKEIVSGDVFSVAQLSRISLYKNLHSSKCNTKTRVPKKQKKRNVANQDKHSKPASYHEWKDTYDIRYNIRWGLKALFTFESKLDTIVKSPTYKQKADKLKNLCLAKWLTARSKNSTTIGVLVWRYGGPSRSKVDIMISLLDIMISVWDHKFMHDLQTPRRVATSTPEPITIYLA